MKLFTRSCESREAAYLIRADRLGGDRKLLGIRRYLPDVFTA